MAKKSDDRLIVGLDIGTSKVLAIVGEANAGGEIEDPGRRQQDPCEQSEGHQHLDQAESAVALHGITLLAREIPRLLVVTFQRSTSPSETCASITAVAPPSTEPLGRKLIGVVALAMPPRR